MDMEGLFLHIATKMGILILYYLLWLQAASINQKSVLTLYMCNKLLTIKDSSTKGIFFNLLSSNKNNFLKV